MRTKNKFISKNKFLSYAKWKDRGGVFFIFPSIMIETKVDLGIEVQVSRLTWAIGRYRWRLDIGNYQPLPSGDIVWSKVGLDSFSRWAKNSCKRKWGKSDIENVIKDKNEWKKLIVKKGLDKHYMRILIAREIMDNEQTSVYDHINENEYQSGAARDLIRVLNNEKDRKRDEDMMDPLDSLSKKITRNSASGTLTED